MVNRRDRAEGHRTSNLICRICLKRHPLRYYKKFLQVDYEERMRLVSIYRYCAGCLAHDHTWRTCESTSRCERCGDMHHTLLHKPNIRNISANKRTRHQRRFNKDGRENSSRGRRLDGGHESERPNTSQALVLSKTQDRNARRRRNKKFNAIKRSTVARTVYVPNIHDSILLKPTVVLNIEAKGRFISVRAILDANSDISIISEEVANRISARRIHVDNKEKCLIKINGNHGSSSTIEIYSEIKRSFKMILPPRSVDDRILEEFPGLQLADPNFNISTPVNVLLGGDVYSRVIRNGIYGGSFGKPLAQFTIFGYIISFYSVFG
ncbi:uncharacterized protein LOC111689753 [Lucilia cuprina]|uniref:uncharacterized protein LOC111689753 n=1 Tax=Lucilia cuprina TaxID=7375 RepID=UPI001F06065A|nr:uncharacterized protein LOC111689753 [Lucilia cuprina]